jgi:hypothetical protein
MLSRFLARRALWIHLSSIYPPGLAYAAYKQDCAFYGL